jgi:glycosyltransferase involved in cell wall biosynthesis
MKISKISVVTPIYNEAKNIPILFGELSKVLDGLGVEYEIIAVNDGSKDDSADVLRQLSKKDKRYKAINFKVNCGQTAAISAGITHATGDIIIPIDSDLENDPHDIPKLLEKLDEGFDVVSGWRQNRWSGHFLTRKLPSMTANWLISKITAVPLHDYGCILKAYRREVLSETKLYGEMHRFIPAYASWNGAKVTEVVVTQRPRIHGKSNYGFGRTFRVLLDLVVIRFLDNYMDKPMHFFGGIGFISFGLGMLSGITSVVLKIIHLRDFVATPLPIFSALFLIVGVQLIAMGILAEILMRVYYESKNNTPYLIKEKINFD